MKTQEAMVTLEALNFLNGRQLPLKFAYAAARNRRKLAELAQVYESSRQGLLQRYGKKDAAGAFVVEGDNIQLEDAPAFNAAFQALGATEVDDLVLHRVALTEFPKDIEIGVMEALFSMVDE